MKRKNPSEKGLKMKDKEQRKKRPIGLRKDGAIIRRSGKVESTVK